jgi:hypothetical protein
MAGQEGEYKTNQMRILQLLNDGDVVKLDVEVLVDALERAAELDVVLELDGDLMVDERLEEARDGMSASRHGLLSLRRRGMCERGAACLIFPYLKKSIVDRWPCRAGCLW